jgi:predicted RNA-binding Zn-ribbon protein involved in translation (DUF1610 family)
MDIEFDIEPVWTDIAPLYCEWLESGTSDQKDIARKEIMKMAKAVAHFRAKQKEREQQKEMFGITVGDTEEGIAGEECPNCKKGELEADSQSFERGTIYCTENCGFTIFSENRGWFITDIVVEA